MEVFVPREEGSSPLVDQPSLLKNEEESTSSQLFTSDILNNNNSIDEDKPLPRQKRKRTSPEDQAVLENAFLTDSKPDKAKRLHLVEQVALDEKEVQIWFQNRRQTSRRKSRPLLPHEIARLLDSATQTDNGAPDCNVIATEPETSGRTLQASPLTPSTSIAQAEPATSAIDSISAPSTQSETQIEASQNHEAASDGVDCSARQSDQIGYLANRRSALNLQGESANPEFKDSQPSVEISDTRHIKKTPSFVRLSMTSEGKAIIKEGLSPSPPKAPQTCLGDVDPIRAPAFRTSSIGRSRDSRSWQFWCDKESRDDFKHAAEKDASGSAAGAIGLYRSASRGNAAGTASLRKTSTSGKVDSKRQRLGSRAPLSRSNTAQGRMQGQPKRTDRCLEQEPPRLKPVASAIVSRPFVDNDSNKENISPGGEDENFDPEDDAEVRSFMRGNRKNADDMDVVQGLLSLSQGNWRQ